MSQTVSDDDDYVAPIIKTKSLPQRRRTSIFVSNSSLSGIKIKRKTKLFGSLPKIASGSRAKLLWEKLRANVLRGFFRNILNQKAIVPTFANIVQDLWNQVLFYSQIEAKKECIKVGSSKNIESYLCIQSIRSKGYDDLNLDNAPNHRISATLLTIGKKLYDQKPDSRGFYGSVGSMNRAWKLILLGLVQAEPMARYLAMIAIQKAIPALKRTLFEIETLEEIINALNKIVDSDEHRENRLKAIYILGQIGLTGGSVSEYADLLFSKRDPSPELQRLKVSLFHSLGKFTTFFHHKSYYMQDMILYLIHEEFGLIPPHCDLSLKGNPIVFILMSILGILDHDFYKTDLNSVYVGSLFKKYIHPLMKSDIPDLQRLAVQFVSNWLPITEKDALIKGLSVIGFGLEKCSNIISSLHHQKRFENEAVSIKTRLKYEKLKLAHVERSLHLLTQPPGTWESLYPVPGYPGFFLNSSASLRNTEALLVNLPINPDASLSISMCIPSIPGVPAGNTTVPFLFADASESNFHDPVSRYEFREISGSVPDLPIGYSFSPGRITDANSEGMRQIDSTVEFLSSVLPLPDREYFPIKIPEGTTAIPPKVIEAFTSDPRRIPYGFLASSPHPGYDPEKLDNIRMKPISNLENLAIQDIPHGFTSKRNPVLWPIREVLSKNQQSSDFLLNARLVFDIIDPELGKFDRVLAIVKAIDQELSPVIGSLSETDSEIIIGSRFNLYIRSRNHKWTAIHLEIIDDQYPPCNYIIRLIRQGSDFFQRDVHTTAAKNSDISNIGTKTTHDSVTIITPVPAGLTANEEPYFAPPANLPPTPQGYTDEGIPFYGSTPQPQPHPLGLTSEGIHYFFNDGKLITPDSPARCLTGGYSYNGTSFFVPKGRSLPSPTGYTSSGIPYYSIQTMVLTPGRMILPPQPHHFLGSLHLTDDEKLNALLSMRARDQDLSKRIEQFFSNLDDHLSILKSNITEASKKYAYSKTTLKTNIMNLLNGDRSVFFKETENVGALLKEVDQFFHLKPNTMRLNIEPPVINFQSVSLTISKLVVIRYKAQRSDRSVRDLFVSVQPSDVFSVSISHLVLQGEGIQDIDLSFNPLAMKSDHLEGTLSLIDNTGKCLASSTLLAVRQPFFTVTQNNIDGGWISPDNSKMVSFKVTNASNSPMTLNFSLLNYKVLDVGHQSKSRNAFELSKKSCQLRPKENAQIEIDLHASAPGFFEDIVEIAGPGGDMAKIFVNFTSGVPIVIYPEAEDDSTITVESLSRERSAFLNKFSSNPSRKIRITERDRPILQAVMATLADGLSKDQIVDFGICEPSKSITRSLTVFNLSDKTIFVALHCRHKSIQCPNLIELGPKLAKTISIGLNYSQEGNFNGFIDVICSYLQDTKINIRAFFGQPLVFLTWEYVFFKACHIDRSDSLVLPLINRSHYPLKFRIQQKSIDKCERSSNISSLTDLEYPPVIQPFSIIPIPFTFNANDLGPFIQIISLLIFYPTPNHFNCTLLRQPLKLIGICISRENACNIKALDYVKKWISTSIMDNEYPTSSERESLFLENQPSSSNKNEDFRLLDEFPRSFLMPGSYFDTSAGTPEGFKAFRSKSVAFSFSNSGKTMKSLSIFSSPLFTPSLRNAYIEPGEVRQFEIVFSPPSHIPPYIPVKGAIFAVAEEDGSFDSGQIVAEQTLNVIVTPFPNSDGITFLDFGMIEASGGGIEAGQVSELTVTIHNLQEESICWLLKINDGSKKYNSFTFSKKEGELFKGESNSLRIRFASEASGYYDAIAEIYARKTDSKELSFCKIGFLSLKGQACVSSISEVPDLIDFGCVLVSEECSKSFTATNSGNFKSRISMLASLPFSVIPNTIELSPKTSCKFTVSFKPSESGNVISKLHLFHSNKHQIIILNATGGTAELISEKYHKKTIDFGFQMEDTISWISIYLTNRGTLPLAIHKVTSTNPTLVRLNFVGVTNTVSNTSSASSADIFRERDLWSFVRRRLAWIVSLKDMKAISSTIFEHKSNERPHSGKHGHRISVLSDSYNALNSTDSFTLIPRLQPYHSYHFRLGYRSIYRKNSISELSVAYKFDLNESSENASIKSLKIKMKGSGFRPLEFIPKAVDFGLVPIESNEANRSKNQKESEALSSLGIMKGSLLSSIPTQIVKVVNFSFENQDFFLRSIHSDYSINNLRWSLSPGMKVEIPIEFHPTKGQVRVLGAAVFKHQYGEKAIVLSGTGGSSQWSSEHSLDWGNIKIGSKVEKSFSVRNVGYLPMNIELEIIQSTQNYRFISGDPLEYRDTILPGTSVSIKILLDCIQVSTGPTHIKAFWQKVSNTEWITTTVPLKSKIGVPSFKISFSELDFGTVYIDTEKSIPFKIMNDGNALCTWTSEIAGSFITLDQQSGQIEAGEAITIHIKFSPKTYDSLKTRISFNTDAGVKTTTCYGVVGVPYLKIPPGHLHVDFGISCIGKPRFSPITLANTGGRTIEFQFTIIEQFQDKVPLASMDFDIFYFEPSCGSIAPGEMLVAKLFIKPRLYLGSYELNFNISTKDGESYSGVATGVGGKGIAKISSQPSTVAKSIASSDRESIIRAKQEVLFAHIENLKDIIAGLHVAEMEDDIQSHSSKSMSGSNSSSRPVSVQSSGRQAHKSLSHNQIFDGSTLRHSRNELKQDVPKSSALSFVADLEKLEKDFELQLKQLDDNGGLIPSSPASPRSQLTSAKSLRPGSVAKKKTNDLDEVRVAEDSLLSGETRFLMDQLTNTADSIEKSVENISSKVESIKHSTSESETKAILDQLTGFDMNNISLEIIKETFKVVKTVKEKLTDGKWIRNKDFLAHSLRKLEKSADLIDLTKTPQSSLPAPIFEEIYDFGLIRSGTVGEPIGLFDISNDGNMAFPFVVVADRSDVVRPREYSDVSIESLEPPFSIQPSYGDVSPGTTVSLKSTFLSYECGIYRQKYNVMSDEDLVRSFILKCRTGSPILESDITTLDFGLVNRHTESKISWTLSNVGTYKDTWKLEFSGESASAVQVFSSSIEQGFLDPGEKTIINIIFHPTKEGEFKSSLKIVWLKDPIVIPLCGLGGGSKFEFKFTSTLDEIFKGLDWGTCVIGNIYEKTIIIENVGNIEGFAGLVFDKYFKFDFERNHCGLLPIMNGSSKDVKIIFEPLQVENIKEFILVTQENGSPLPLPFKFKAGTCSWKLEGDLSFLNMKYYTREERKIFITNDGTLDIPISYKFLAGNTTSKYYEILFKPDWSTKKQLKPGEVLEICLAMIPEEIAAYEGCLQIFTHLTKPVMQEFPFKFQTFKDEIAFDNESDISVGRILMGTSIEVSRSITNFGNYDEDWRVLLESVPLADGKIHKIWSLVGASGIYFDINLSEGRISPGHVETLTFRFAAPEGELCDLVESTVTVERKLRLKDDEWINVGEFKLQGANGVPKLTFEPSVVSFGRCSINSSVKAEIVLNNEGNATVEYSVSNIWQYNDQISFEDNSLMTGSINPSESIKVVLIFAPKEVMFYDSDITFTTQIANRVLRLSAQGVEYKLNSNTLPKEVDLGKLDFCRLCEFNLPIWNGCKFDIEGNCYVYSTDPKLSTIASLSEFISVEPPVFSLSTSQDSASANLRIKAFLDIKTDKNGLLDSEYLSMLSKMESPQGFLKISVTAGSSYVIPINLSFSVHNIIFLEGGQYDHKSAMQNNCISELNFGSLPYGSGGSLDTVIYNPNVFEIAFWPEIEGDQFTVISSSKTIGPKMFVTISVTLLNREFEDDEIAPSSQLYSGKITLTTHLDSMSPVVLPLRGTLIDVSPALEVIQSVNFGSLLAQKSRTHKFNLKNPSRRMLNWKIFVSEEYRGIFNISGEDFGVLMPKKNIELSIMFSPQFPIEYFSKAYLESDQGNFIIDLVGDCVAPKLECEESEMFFGVVGVSRPEFREISVSNPTRVPFTVRARSENSDFLVCPLEFLLNPNCSRSLKITFNPANKGESSGALCFSYLEEEERSEEVLEDVIRDQTYSAAKDLDILYTVKLKGIGGEFGIQINDCALDDEGPVMTETIESSRDEKDNPLEKISDSKTNPKSGVTVSGNRISMDYAKITTGTSVTKTFEIKNTGDTVIETMITDCNGAEIKEGSFFGKNKRMSLKFSSTKFIIEPHSTAKIEIIVEGGDEGQDEAKLLLSLPGHSNPISYELFVDSTVLPVMTSESVKAFARSDTSVFPKIKLNLIEEVRYFGEEDLWKVTCPAIRLSQSSLDSYCRIPFKEPSVLQPDLGPWLIRPPAIPAILSSQGRKWYSKRMSMSLEKPPKQFPDSIKKPNLIASLVPIEKRVKLKE